MSSNLIIITGLIYLYIALENLFQGKLGMSYTYFGYAFANYGLYLLEQKAT